RRRPLAAGQAWQARLWRELLDGLGDAARLLVRPQVHQRVLRRLLEAPAGSLDLPRRVSLFGAATIAPSVLELLVALSRHAQVVVAVPNPCRFHWADVVEGRELLRATRRRHALRGGMDLAEVPLQAMHAHAHPLLAAWGRQGRDFMRQLDACEAEAQAGIEFARTDVFDESPPRSLLEHVQAAIRDLLPLAEHARAVVPDDDDSIQFQITHGSQREVEVLHDRLLDLLARDDGSKPRLRPRDIVVMVPDIEVFAPAVRAVFGQYAADDPRHIPFDIADLRRRSSSSMLLALEWLLAIPRRRVTLSEICDLLEVPALAGRLGLDAAGRALLVRWMSAAGARWGLHAGQRASLGLPACGDANSWSFGLRRMLLGYASGAGRSWRDIEPLPQVGGLDAALVGVLHALLDLLDDWWSECRQPAAPQQWAQRARELLERSLKPADDQDRRVLAAMHEGLAQWLHDCDCAGFEQPLALEVFAQAWLERIDDTTASGRFLAGGVTFCSLLPLRAIPFEVVCLLGMNEDAYPRVGQRGDFDLMAQPGLYRAGDRSWRDDDRYLMLEALLSARRVLYLSWCGRSARDNTELAPSVLVSQLRDYLAAGFGAPEPRPGESPGQALLRVRTTEHALQPFSRRYFEPGGLRTWAREWFGAHDAPAAGVSAGSHTQSAQAPGAATL
ncbi:MAG: exodeoxyribonuclease V subunit gamma, partial [Betaproteobacteria bacterium]|nr:exodeoxyribonuclease V subunit gamma [Betaproteobacteria bacterium]